MNEQLFMLLLGCKPKGRHTEQHDIFFGIAPSLKELVPAIKAYWPEAEEKIHIDAWRKVTLVDGYTIEVVPFDNSLSPESGPAPQLFFLNLGGYKENDFEEYHYKLLVVAEDKTTAIQRAKQTAFFKHNASPHIDDKYGVDVDDIYELEEILPETFKEKFTVRIRKASGSSTPDTIHPEYLKLSKLENP